MIRKDKVFELKIEEDDELSGIDSISLVDEPAIEINWMFFNKVKPEEFHIPEGQDNVYLEKFLDKGQNEEELLNDGWEVYKTEYNNKENFIDANPNAPSFEDTDQYLIRYKYILNPEAPGSPIKETTRDFCRDLVVKNWVFRIEDIENITNDEGSPAMVWRGGYNCRHLWSKITYRRGTDINIKSSDRKGRVDTGLDTNVLGYPQPDTRVPEWPSFNKQGFQEDCPIATQDVETNLKNRQRAIDEAHYGPLNPNEPNEEYWKKKADMFGGDVESAKKARCGNCAFFVKTPSMLQCIADGINDVNELDTIQAANIGYCEAFDFKCAGARTCDAWVVGGPITQEDMGYDVGGIGGYVDPGVTGKTGNTISKSLTPPTMFESHSDYPDSVKNNAKAVLKYVEENGWGSCGTEVGKIRANQLANGEPISEETIQRMYSYLSRHKVDLDSSKSYDDNCGKLMYDSWGGLSALSWAESKVNSFEKKQMSKQHFQVENEEKRIVVGPAMVPDLKIFRKDALGNPYYVFFSAETIKMIAEKYMRNKYIDNNDENHDGKAVKDVYVIESWIKEDEQDKSSKYGYESTPVGTWFVSMKVKNDQVWEKIKNGGLNGFSVSGYFEEVKAFTKEEMFLYKVSEILKNIKE